MTDAELQYFTHSVDGARYGAWYRVISSDHLEVIGVGMLETSEYAGISPESTARSMLENFVRQQKSLGIVMPCLDEEEDTDLHESPLHESPLHDSPMTSNRSGSNVNERVAREQYPRTR
jgi:hypothetical protein